MTPRDLTDADGRPLFDLQSHSVESDGALEPEEVVARAAAAGVQLLSLTDHDSVDGVARAIAAGAEHGVGIVPGVELSTIDPLSEDLHLLGYGFDPASPVLLETLIEYRGDREARGDRMIDALKELGWQLDEAKLDARKAAGSPIGRPHIAEAVFEHPANAARLQEEGLAGNPTDVLVAYLIPGTPAYRTRTFPSVEQAIALVHDAGGLAVWAHPFFDLDQPADVRGALERFAAAGLDGLEAFYVTHDEQQTLFAVDAAEQLGLLTTGSADFHGPAHKHFSAFRNFELHARAPRLGRLADYWPT